MGKRGFQRKTGVPSDIGCTKIKRGSLEKSVVPSIFSGLIAKRSPKRVFFQMVAVSFTLEDSDNFYEMRVWVDDESEVATKTTASPKEATTSAQESKATVAEKESTTTTNAQDSKTTVSGKDTTTSSTENPSLSMILLAIVAVILG